MTAILVSFRAFPPLPLQDQATISQANKKSFLFLSFYKQSGASTMLTMTNYTNHNHDSNNDGNNNSNNNMDNF